MVIKQAAFIFPREQESVQEFAIQWKTGDYGNGSLRLIFTAFLKDSRSFALPLPLWWLHSSTQASSTGLADPSSPQLHWTVQQAPKPALRFILILGGSPATGPQFPCSHVSDEMV